MNKKIVRITESDLHRIVKESVKRALMENTYNTHQYQVVAYLIDPNADWQRGELSSDSYEESKRDFELLSNLDGNLNRQAMNIFRKYQINNGAVEEHDSEEPFMMDIDGDGIYLLKRIDQNVQAAWHNLSPSQVTTSPIDLANMFSKRSVWDAFLVFQRYTASSM